MWRRAPQLLGLVWLVAAAFAVLGPALAHGDSLGPFDALYLYGLSAKPGALIHDLYTVDQVRALLPWSTLAWTQVHSGHLPLWNPFSGLGMPLAFNWQSAVLSLPTLVGYLFPVHLTYTIQLLITLVIAGTGVYFLGRVLGLGVLACTFGGTVFELSGSVVGWLGWPHAAVAAWAGWVFGSALLVIRGERRARSVALLALSVAFMVYAGQPEITFLFAVAFVVFLVVFVQLGRHRSIDGSGREVRRLLDLFAGLALGGALAAPLALPGLQLTQGTVRAGKTGGHALPAHTLIYTVVQGFDGWPVSGSHWFGPLLENETAACVGVIALVLCVLAVALCRRRRETLALVAVAVVTAALVYFQPLVTVMNNLPFHDVQWHRALLPLAFSLAVLAAIGMDELVRSPTKPAVITWLGAGFATAGLLLLLVWAVGRGRLPHAEAVIRAESFIWPAAQVMAGLLVAGGLWMVCRRDRQHSPGAGTRGPTLGKLAGSALLAIEAGFLVSAGAPLFSSSSQFFAPTAAEVALEHDVGSAVVGLGTNSCNTYPVLGIAPDVNIVYGIHELAIYDPIIPRTYFQSWTSVTGMHTHSEFGEIFCPALTTSAIARLYGVSFVLEPSGASGPVGSVFDAHVGDEDLYRIPDAGVATLTPATGPAKTFPPVDAPGQVVPASHPNPSSWELRTTATTAQILRLRLTDVPGWHATIDGRPLVISPFADVMMQVRIPPGRHTIQLHYWPPSFTHGLILAACGLVGLLLLLGTRWFPRPQRPAGGTAQH